MNDNNVYGFGERIHESLGYYKSEEKYVLINVLNDKNIQHFYQGLGFMFARSDNNEIFSWGENHCEVLARGYQIDFEEYLRPEKIDFFDEKNIIKISCGTFHCLAFSSDGRVFGWGNNIYGSVGYGDEKGSIISLPIEIKFKQKIKFIHCTTRMSFAVSFEGNPYYWGYSYSRLLSPRRDRTFSRIITENDYKRRQYKISEPLFREIIIYSRLFFMRHRF